MAHRFLSVLALIALFTAVASAQHIYKWKDKKGQWHFSDNPPPEIRAEKVKGIDIGPVPPVPPQIAEPPVPSEASEIEEKAVSKPRLTEEVSREQTEYHKRLEEIAQQIEALKKRYDLIHDQLTRAKGGVVLRGESIVIVKPGKYIVYPKRAIRPGVVPPDAEARSIVPRGGYNESELRRLGNQLDKLYKKRDKLIQEMRQKGFETVYTPN